MKRILTILLVCLPFLTYAQTYNCEFVRTQVIKVSGKKKEMKGHITFDGKEKLDMQYSDPQGDYFVIDGNTVSLKMNGKTMSVNADKRPLFKLQRATLLACLRGDWQQAAKDNNAQTEVSEKGGMTTVTMTIDKVNVRGGYKKIVLTYAKSDGMLHKMVLVDTSDIENTYVL